MWYVVLVSFYTSEMNTHSYIPFLFSINFCVMVNPNQGTTASEQPESGSLSSELPQSSFYKFKAVE